MNEILNKQLLNACNKGNLAYIKKIAGREDIDLDYRNDYGYTALTYACLYNHLDIVQYLLSSQDLTHHANINKTCTQGRTPLMYACSNGYLDIVKYLTSSPELKEVANLYHKRNRLNALMCALVKSHYEVARYLIVEKNMIVDNETMSFLIEKKYDDIVEIIKTRDLYFKIDSELTSNKSMKKRKI